MGVILILLDTHVLLWATEKPERLSRTATSAIRRARRHDGVAISAITLWELSWMFASRRLQSFGTIESSLRMLVEDVVIRPITPEVAALATQFPDDYPHDPADRLIGATARAEGVALVTRDERIRRCPLLQTIW